MWVLIITRQHMRFCNRYSWQVLSYCHAPDLEALVRTKYNPGLQFVHVATRNGVMTGD